MSITEIFNNVKLIQRPPLDRYKTKCMGVTVFTRSGVIVQNRSRLCVASDKPEVSHTKYNRAEEVVRKQAVTDLQHFPPSQIINKHPENDRIILINQLQKHLIAS